jgi:hypothetical protein
MVFGSTVSILTCIYMKFLLCGPWSSLGCATSQSVQLCFGMGFLAGRSVPFWLLWQLGGRTFAARYFPPTCGHCILPWCRSVWWHGSIIRWCPWGQHCWISTTLGLAPTPIDANLVGCCDRSAPKEIFCWRRIVQFFLAAGFVVVEQTGWLSRVKSACSVASKRQFSAICGAWVLLLLHHELIRITTSVALWFVVYGSDELYVCFYDTTYSLFFDNGCVKLRVRVWSFVFSTVSVNKTFSFVLLFLVRGLTKVLVFVNSPLEAFFVCRPGRWLFFDSILLIVLWALWQENNLEIYQKSIFQ